MTVELGPKRPPAIQLSSLKERGVSGSIVAPKRADAEEEEPTGLGVVAEPTWLSVLEGEDLTDCLSRPAKLKGLSCCRRLRDISL